MSVSSVFCCLGKRISRAARHLLSSVYTEHSNSLSVLSEFQASHMRRIAILFLPLVALFSPIAAAETYQCRIDLERRTVFAAPSVSFTGASFSVDTATGEIKGLGLSEFQLMQNLRTGGDPQTGNFWVDFDTADNRFKNYLVLHPASEDEFREFDFQLGVIHYSGRCTQMVIDPTNNDATGQLFF